jgi:hypothetical protein
MRPDLHHLRVRIHLCSTSELERDLCSTFRLSRCAGLSRLGTLLEILPHRRHVMERPVIGHPKDVSPYSRDLLTQGTGAPSSTILHQNRIFISQRAGMIWISNREYIVLRR